MKNIKLGLYALAATASMAHASVISLPTPEPSPFPDAESSVTLPTPVNEGRHIKLTLAFEPTPSNAVLVAFGRDRNGSETLEPEETDVIVGVDCGEVQMKVEGEGVEVKVKGESEQWNLPTCSVVQAEQESNLHCSPSPSSSSSPSPLTFTLKQSRIVSDRCNLAKVTTHNLANTNLTVTAEFHTKGTKLILR